MFKTLHPVRATLAVSLWIATLYFKYLGIELGPEWWTLVGAVSGFYFASTREG